MKDLCARLPYAVKMQVNNKIEILEGISIPDNVVEYDSFLSCEVGEVKPFLFPLSSMTDEQKSRYNFYLTRIVFAYYASLLIDWLNKNHFDYRGLIKKGLAIDATGLNVY